MKTSGLQVTPHMPCQYFWNASYFLVSHYFKPTFTCMLTFACMFAHSLFLHLPLHFKNSTLATIISFLRIGSFTKCYYACHFHIRNPKIIQNDLAFFILLHPITVISISWCLFSCCSHVFPRLPGLLQRTGQAQVDFSGLQRT